MKQQKQPQKEANLDDPLFRDAFILHKKQEESEKRIWERAERKIRGMEEKKPKDDLSQQ